MSVNAIFLAALQRGMNARGANLEVDGNFGPKSRAAALALENRNASGIRSDADVVGDRMSVTDRIRILADEAGVPFNTAIVIARIESNLDPKAVNPTTKAAGLYQLTSVAIKDVAERFPSYVPPPNGDKLDVDWNIRTGLMYIRICSEYAKVPMDDIATVYMVFNIGYGNYLKLKSGKVNDPGLKRAVAAQAKALSARGPASYALNVRSVILAHSDVKAPPRVPASRLTHVAGTRG